MSEETLELRVRTIPISDDAVDAAAEAVMKGLRDLLLEEIDYPNDPDGTIVLAFRLKPVTKP